uniref:Uncharacterized protein n=1 Tax=Ignisphaera aggregans TaxID=334771 RepID=A0A7C5UT11_9CREN
MTTIMPNSETYLTPILQLLNRLGVEELSNIVRRAIKLISEKGVSINHVLAELLIYYYLLRQGYSYVSIEESVGIVRCDVYAVKEEFNICIEIEFYSVPQDFVLNRTKYILARHIRKLIQIAKSNIKAAVFAYPYGSIPLVPLEIMKPIDNRSKKKIVELVSSIREMLPLDNSDIDYLMKVEIHSIYIFDIDTGKIYELTPSEAEYLITLYENRVLRK